MSGSYSVANSIETKEELNRFLNEARYSGLFRNLYDRFNMLDLSCLDFTIQFENEPQELNFTLNFCGKEFNFSTYINIDKIYRFFENNNCNAYRVSLDELDLNLSIKASGNTRFPNRPILVITDKILLNVFTLDYYKGNYYPIDGRNRIRLHMNLGFNEITCYPVNIDILLNSMMSEYDSLAIELLISFIKEFGY